MEKSEPDQTVAATVDLETTLGPSGAILRAQIMLGRALDLHTASLSPYDATTIDLLVRIKLSDDGGLRAVDICDQLQKSPSHVSRVIDRAESDGLVKRLPDPSDRRAHLVALTDEGATVVDELAPHIAGVLDKAIFDVLSADEISALVALLGRITLASRKLIAK
jgi:DNA-binding MarR family transcriptional regulator